MSLKAAAHVTPLTPTPSLENAEPIFRGRKLILNYTGGSLCPSTASNRRSPVSLPREIIGDDDDDDDDKKHDSDKDKDKDADKKKPSTTPERRKTTVISLLCENDPLAKSSFSFVAAVDDCTYFFEGRSRFACGIVHADEQTLSPGGVFGVIALIAVLVYFVGGCVYQRTVMHQRGWRQLPNYAMWAGIWRFFTVRLLYSFVRLSPLTPPGHVCHSHLVVCPLPALAQGVQSCFARRRREGEGAPRREREQADRPAGRGVG